MSSKDERHGFFAVLWFAVANYCLRPWPWILAALAALVLYPDLPAGRKEEGYAMLIGDVLPSPYRGLLLAAFFGAYMSTLSTQIHWGASYLVNDLYRRFHRPDADESALVFASRIASGLILAVSLLVSFTVLDSVAGAWEMLLEFGAGTGFVLIFRWYWWRLNAAGEIASMLVPVAAVLILRSSVLDGLLPALYLTFPGSLYLIVPLSIITTLVVTLSTRPEPDHLLRDFYLRVLPAGPGWRRFSSETGELSRDSLSYQFLGWISSTLLVYGLLFFIGQFLLGNRVESLTPLLIALAGGVAVLFSILKMFPEKGDSQVSKD